MSQVHQRCDPDLGWTGTLERDTGLSGSSTGRDVPGTGVMDLPKGCRYTQDRPRNSAGLSLEGGGSSHLVGPWPASLLWLLLANVPIQGHPPCFTLLYDLALLGPRPAARQREQ